MRRAAQIDGQRLVHSVDGTLSQRRRFTSAPRLCLVRDGKLLRKNMRREFITDEELNAKIRHEGVEDIATVKRMYLEADGEMSVIRNDEPSAAA